MKITSARSLLASAFLSSFAGLVGCDKINEPDPPARLDIQPRRVAVSVAGREAQPTDTATLRVIARDETGQEQRVRVSFTSANPQIATVDGNGVVRGVSPGLTQVIARVGSKSDTAGVRVLEAGRYIRYNVNASQGCSSGDFRLARVVAETERAIVVADTANPGFFPASGSTSSGVFTEADYREFGIAFDTLVYPVVTRAFGEPGQVPGGNSKVALLFTKAVNDLTPEGSSSFVGGFFFGRDLFPTTANPRLDACATSNEALLFYMLVPDPARGSTGPFTVANVRRGTVGVIAHEFQHLINASRRLFVNSTPSFEEVWLNEGLSHIAEELMFYRTARLEPRRNIDIPVVLSSEVIRNAFNSYQSSNSGRYASYLRNPEKFGPYQSNDSLAVRGATWSLLRYLADQRGGSDRDFFFALVNSNTRGLANLQQVLGTDPIPPVRDWTVSNYTDDAVPGVERQFQQPSWNYRSLFARLFRTEAGGPDNGVYPLRTHPLTDTATISLTLGAGSAAFFRFAVPPGTRAEIRMTSGGVAPTTSSCLAEGPALRLAVGQVSTQGQTTVVCVEGGASGGEFTLIPFHGTRAQAATLALDVAATGVGPAIGPPNPAEINAARLGAGLPAFGIGGGALPYRRDDRWEWRFRERERQQMAELVPGGHALRPAFSRSRGATALEDLLVSVVRTR